MGCSMHASAAALVRASVLARDLDASPGEIRQALFLRFYAHEFDAGARERILKRLGLDRPIGPMAPMRRVPVDWDSLETALTSSPAEWTSYLDLETGEVLTVAVFPTWTRRRHRRRRSRCGWTRAAA